MVLSRKRTTLLKTLFTMSKIQLTDPAILKKRILCSIIGKQDYFEGMVLEISPSGRWVRFMQQNGVVTWGSFPLVQIVEVLADDPSFGQLSPCS